MKCWLCDRCLQLLSHLSGDVSHLQLGRLAAMHLSPHGYQVDVQASMASRTTAQQIELILDRHHAMTAKGKPVASSFDPTMVVKFYHQLHSEGVPLTCRQVAALDSIIRKWYIHTWAAKNYPAQRNRAPPPPAPPAEPVDDVGFAFQSDDEADGQQ